MQHSLLTISLLDNRYQILE